MDERHTKQILLVEDEALIAMTKKLALEKYGYSVLTVGSGEKAVETLGTSPGINLILMDIDLGKGMDGTRAAELILKEHDLPVVFLSSHTEPEVVEKTEKITSYGYVVKSSTITVLDASIKMAFKLFDANRRLTEELKERKRIEHSLSHAQMSWESTFNSMNDIVSMISVDHRFMALNQAGVQSLNLPKEKIIGRKCYEIVHATSAPIDQCPCTRALESGKEEVSEFYDGKNYYILQANPMYDEAGAISSFVHVIENITEQRLMEDARRQSEERFAASFRHAVIGMAIVSPEGMFLKGNQALCNMLGYSEEELKVIPFQDITHPDDIEENLSFVGRMLAGEIDNFQMEKRYIHKNGRIVWAQLNVAHLRDREGKSLYSISQIVDITHHKLMEEELRLTVEKYQNLAEGTEAVLWEYNIGLDHWTYVAPQAEWILGWAPDQWKNLKFWTDHIHEDDRAWAADYCFACTSRGERHTFEYRFYAGNGNLRWIRDVVSVEMENDRPVILRGFMLDITERKTKEEQIKLLLKEKEEAVRRA